MFFITVMVSALGVFLYDVIKTFLVIPIKKWERQKKNACEEREEKECTNFIVTNRQPQR